MEKAFDFTGAKTDAEFQQKLKMAAHYAIAQAWENTASKPELERPNWVFASIVYATCKTTQENISRTAVEACIVVLREVCKWYDEHVSSGVMLQ